MYCEFCGPSVQAVDIHHRVPRRYGGGDDPGNLIPVCEDCHNAYHAEDFSIFGRIGGLKRAASGMWVHNLRQYKALTYFQREWVRHMWMVENYARMQDKIFAAESVLPA